jgi:hypothetical protein
MSHFSATDEDRLKWIRGNAGGSSVGGSGFLAVFAAGAVTVALD